MFNLLKKIHRGEQKTLECGHVFHWSCIRHWALKTDEEMETYEYIKPINNRRIHLFKQGQNIFTCPCCRLEYTSDSFTHDIKRVLAKVHIENKGEHFVHYITNEFETLAYVPLSEINDGHINGKWGTILTLLKTAWERGDNDIYCMIRLYPEPEFILCNSKLKTPPLDKNTGRVKQEIKDKQLMLFRMVEVEELYKLLNNC